MQLRLGDLGSGRLEGQIQDKAVCERDSSHPTTCFRARGSGQLYWRCDGAECVETDGVYKGSGRLLGPDGKAGVRDESRPVAASASRPAGPTASGTLLTLPLLNDRILAVSNKADAILAMLGEIRAEQMEMRVVVDGLKQKLDDADGGVVNDGEVVAALKKLAVKIDEERIDSFQRFKAVNKQLDDVVFKLLEQRDTSPLRAQPPGQLLHFH